MRASDIVSSGSFLRLVELFPPGMPAPHLMNDSQKFDLSVRFEKLVESISSLETVADAFSLPELREVDRIHLNSVGVASELSRRTGNAVIPTITLRDSNRQGILGTIAYAIYSGLENLQIVRGDPFDKTDGTLPKNVYDVQKISTLVKTIRTLEKHLVNRERLCILAPINLTKLEDKRYAETIRQRESSGVDIFVAESLFEDMGVHLQRVVDARKIGVTAPIVHNIFPLRSYEDGLACRKRFGWKISDAELSELSSGGSEQGVKRARERYHALLGSKKTAQGACISTRGNPELVRQITS